MKKKLRTKMLVVFILMSVFPLALLGTISYGIMSKNILQIFDERVSLQIKSNIENYDQWFDGIENILYVINTSQDTVRYLTDMTDETAVVENYDQFVMIVSNFDTLFSANRYRVDTMMLLPLSPDVPAMFRGNYVLGTQDYMELPVVKEALSKKYAVVWDEYRPKGGESNYIFSAQAILDPYSGESIGVTVVGFEVKHLGNIADVIIGSENEFVYLMDSDNNVIYESQKDISEKISISDVYSDDGQMSEMITCSAKIESERYRIFLSETGHNSMKVVYAIPENNILGNISHFPAIVLVLAIILFIYACIMMFYIYFDLYGPIKKLSDAMNGDILNAQVELKRDDELGQLAENFDAMIVRINALVKNVEEEERRKKDFEMKALQAQITPHFLYNTINSIKALARLGRPDDVVEMSSALIRLLQVSAGSTYDFITLREEIEYVESYISIMRYRFDQTLELECSMEEEIKDSLILKFMLQPIVENSIIHGFANMRNERCIITIHAYRIEEKLWIEVIDNGEGMPENYEEIIRNKQARNNKFSSIGVKNIEQRIELNFGKEYGIKYESKVGTGTKAILCLPYKSYCQSIPQVNN